MTTWTQDDRDSPDRLDACLVGQTPILTPMGVLPLKDVTPGHEVWTRKGWRHVQAARLTARDVPVIAVEMSDGSTLTGTPDHRVWTGQHGWKRLDALVCGDTLSGWKNPPLLSPSTASHTDVTPTGSSEPIGSTTARLAPFAPPTCTAQSGKPNTDRCHGVSTSTTSTTTRSTTNSATSPRSLHLNTLKSTPLSTPSAEPSTQPASGPSPRPGTHHLQVSPGTVNTAVEPGIEVRSLWNASSVGSIMKPSSVVARSATAPETVSTSRPDERAGTKTSCPARSAVHSSRRTGTGLSPSPAVVSVVRLTDAGTADVYDLQVEDVHEFVAAGVIVHNCVYALADLMQQSSATAYVTSIAPPCAVCGLPRRDGEPHACSPSSSADGFIQALGHH